MLEFCVDGFGLKYRSVRKNHLFSLFSENVHDSIFECLQIELTGKSFAFSLQYISKSSSFLFCFPFFFAFHFFPKSNFFVWLVFIFRGVLLEALV